MFDNIYKNKRVLVTGHTGFKGSWLCLWLQSLNAEVAGYALDPPSKHNHFDLLDLQMKDIRGDVRDSEKLKRELKTFRPDIVFHLAAQPLVRYSYENPLETFQTNVMGTLNLFESCRKTDSVAAIVNITSDKCYENKEWIWGYREHDPVGGHDPYSASKGCAELATNSYRRSFFPLDDYQKTHHTLMASARAGNVIGGGDWGDDRLVPDIMRAANKNEKAIIRHPQAIRPWQHVLDPLCGYLFLGEHLLEGKPRFSGAWNFGPIDKGHRSVLSVIKGLQKHWSNIAYEIRVDERNPHEANVLKLDCSKAHAKLKWKPVWDSDNALEKTAKWYKEYYESGYAHTSEQLAEYMADAKHMLKSSATK